MKASDKEAVYDLYKRACHHPQDSQAIDDLHTRLSGLFRERIGKVIRPFGNCLLLIDEACQESHRYLAQQIRVRRQFNDSDHFVGHLCEAAVGRALDALKSQVRSSKMARLFESENIAHPDNELEKMQLCELANRIWQYIQDTFPPRHVTAFFMRVICECSPKQIAVELGFSSRTRVAEAVSEIREAVRVKFLIR